MKTYEDFLAVGEDEKERMNFIRASVNDYIQSDDYLMAQNAFLYFNGENPTINHYEKLIYDFAGRAHVDMWTANHKIASSFFGLVINQEVSYLLGNGIRFGSDSTKKRLGPTFDEDVQDALEYARIGGSSYGFWNQDHIDVFRCTEFQPYPSEETGEIMAGVRFWQLDKNKPWRYTLFEIDGYTEYIQRNGSEMEIFREKRPYKIRRVMTQAEGEISVDAENYPSFPIVPLYANKLHKSALVGKMNTLDALDLVCSNMVNNVDEGNLIYWVLKNAGGMDELDDAEFIRRVKTLHVVHTENGMTEATPATIEAPFEGTQSTIDMLEKKLYDDFQAFNSSAVTATNQSATAIKASYIPLDLKTDMIERQVTRFISRILALAGIDDKPTYERNQLINKTEETQNIVMQAQYFDSEYTMKKMLAINGDLDQYEEIAKRKAEEEIKRGLDLQNEIAVNDANDGGDT
jgi:hypothetical protein